LVRAAGELARRAPELSALYTTELTQVGTCQRDAQGDEYVRLRSTFYGGVPLVDSIAFVPVVIVAIDPSGTVTHLSGELLPPGMPTPGTGCLDADAVRRSIPG